MIDWRDPAGEAGRETGIARPVPPRVPSDYGRLLHRPEPVAPFLRERVDLILAASAVPEAEREDVAEELYGHLYERWREAVDAGADPRDAALQAMAAFGAPGSIGRELTSAYHSRLYASTIGVLLPAGASDASVSGYTRAVVLLGLGMLGDLIVAALLAAFVGPVWALAGIAGCLYLLGLSMLAMKALGRGQEWAVAFVRLVCLFGICGAVLSIPQGGSNALLALVIGIAFPVYVLAGTDVARSYHEPPSVRHRLKILVVATTLAAEVVSGVAFIAPDPTLAGAGDLSMTVASSCPDAGRWSVTAELRWTRTDAFGGRLLPVLNDELGLSIGRDGDVPPDFAGDTGPWFDDDVSDGGVVDASTGAEIPAELSPGDEWSTPPPFYTGNRRLTIDPRTMRVAATYKTTFIMAGTSGNGSALIGDRNRRFRVRYEHLGRWGLEAIAYCGETVAAHPVQLR